MIESLKNGFILSGKYQSTQKIFPIPHVVVFANHLPKKEVYSAQRVRVTLLSPKELIPLDEIATAQYWNVDFSF